MNEITSMDGNSKAGSTTTEVTLRYSDMDAMGHLNNAVYATLFEAGRVDYLNQVLLDLTPEGAGYVIVKLTIEFKTEAHYPGVAVIKTRIVRVGGSSMTYAQEVMIGGKTVATAESICAMFNLTHRKAMRCPEALRMRIAQHNEDARTRRILIE
jgi:acyl-CoA thioester hydrolase